MNKLALFSVPRSGSTWLGEILNSSPNTCYKFQPNFAYSFKLCLNENSSKEEIDNFFEELLVCQDDFVNGRVSISGNRKEFNFEKKETETIIFKETHFINILDNILIKSNVKIIGLIRSPFAVINSWINIPKEFNPEWEINEEWRTASLKNNNQKSHYFGYEKWKQASFLYLDLQIKYPHQFYLVNYSDLLHNSIQEVKKIFSFCQLDYTPQTDYFIKASTTTQSADAYAVFKQKENDLAWKNKLPEQIEKEITNDLDFKKLNAIFKWI